jgi:putative phosphoesterase
MRIAIVSDIHGNLTALDAVIADLQIMLPDLVLHGGDLAAGGARAAEVVDRVRDLGWQGVLGNTDEMLYRPAALTEFAAGLPHLKVLFEAIGETADATREALGSDRIAWLQNQPQSQIAGSVALVHASPNSLWQAPNANAADAELDAPYQSLAQPIVVYAHIHHPFVRRLANRIVANTGSVSLSYDGDWRASYMLVENDSLTIRRVAYDLESECKALAQSGLPHADWVALTLRKSAFVMP